MKAEEGKKGRGEGAIREKEKKEDGEEELTRDGSEEGGGRRGNKKVRKEKEVSREKGIRYFKIFFLKVMPWFSL